MPFSVGERRVHEGDYGAQGVEARPGQIGNDDDPRRAVFGYLPDYSVAPLETGMGAGTRSHPPPEVVVVSCGAELHRAYLGSGGSLEQPGPQPPGQKKRRKGRVEEQNASEAGLNRGTAQQRKEGVESPASILWRTINVRGHTRESVMP